MRRPSQFPRSARGAPRWRERPSPHEPYWIYGHHPVLEALKNPARVRRRLVATRNAARDLPPDAQPEVMDARAIDALLPEDSVHQGIALLADPLPPPPLVDLLDTRRLLIFLDHVSDPHNVGAILRSAAAFGAGGVITTQRHAPQVTGVLAKSASGALEHVPYLQLTNLADALIAAREAGYARLGLDEGGEDLELALAATKAFPVALVLGAEGAGLRERTRATCDRLVRLPTTGAIGALNVSNAAAVALYAVTRSRG
jgi:23S rRNA (guanosine2251-2'-O)-methyltransferase